MNNSSNRQNATSVFIDHVKQLFSTIPPVTRFILYTPFVIFTIEKLLFPILHVDFNLSKWLYLDYNKAVYGLQVFRLALYPFATVPFIQLIITPLWLIPETYKLERRTGSLKFLWILIIVFTILPGIAYIVALKLITINWFHWSIPYFSDYSAIGMTGWIVGLVFWSYLTDDPNSEHDRMIAGAIRIPRKYWPLFVFIFFIFLVPDSSFILNLMAAAAGYLYTKEKLEAFVPSDTKFEEYESKDWLSFLTKSNNYISTNSAGNSYLPIFTPAETSSAHLSTQQGPTPSTGNFPGQGIRLGS